ncbi:MAG: NAD(P)/FAD-dependent oxidoreductase [Gemmatimonadales bacterium]
MNDVIIIGGGVMGAVVAFELSRRGASVLVLEKGALGLGSTGRSSAIIRQHYSNHLTTRMARDSLRVFEAFDDLVGGDCGFRNTGFLAIAGGADAESLRRNVAIQEELDIPCRIVTPDELPDFLPGATGYEGELAAWEPDAGYADPHGTLNGYLDAARRQGARVVVNEEVTGIRFDGDRVVGVDTKNAKYDAGQVVNCAGPWAAQVGAMANLTVPVNSSRAQIAIFRRPAGHEAPHPIVIDLSLGSYFREETGQLTLVGSIDPAEGNDLVNPDDYPEGVENAFIADIGERWVRRCPGMDLAETRDGYSGLYAVTPDWHPIIDEVPAGSGHFVCVGFSGHGFKLAPAVGVMTADLVLHESSPTYDAAAFRADRFESGDVMSGRYASSITG